LFAGGEVTANLGAEVPILFDACEQADKCRLIRRVEGLNSSQEGVKLAFVSSGANKQQATGA
jgi:hypothetical protein